jgi:uncharacterized membrane protein (UPF0136 family)
MSPGKTLRAALGLTTVVSVFFLPLGVNGDSTMFSTFVSQLGRGPGQGLDMGIFGAEIAMLLGVVLVIVGGILGYFPMPSGLLVLFGVLLFATADYSITGQFAVSGSALGLFIPLGCSVGLVMASQWNGRPSPYF